MLKYVGETGDTLYHRHVLNVSLIYRKADDPKPWLCLFLDKQIQVNIAFREILCLHTILYTPVSRLGHIMWLGMAGGQASTQVSLHNNFSSVYWIFTKLGQLVPLWKGKNPIYVGVIRSKVNVTYYKQTFWQQDRFRMIALVLYIGSLPNLATWFPCGRGRTLFILGSLGQRSRSLLL